MKQSIPSPVDELDAGLDIMDAEELLDELDMTWLEGRPSDQTLALDFAAGGTCPTHDAKPSRYKPRTGATRERNIEVQRRYRQRIKEKEREAEDAIAATSAQLAAARAENEALQTHYEALKMLEDYSLTAFSTLRTLSVTVAAAVSSYFHSAQLRVATLHADTLEAMFNALRRPSDDQLRALAADVDVSCPVLDRVSMETMAQLVGLMGEWVNAGAHGRVVVERKLKIMFETRERFANLLLEEFPEKAPIIMERLRLQDRAVVQAQAAGSSMAAVAERSAFRFPLAAFFGSRSAVWKAGQRAPSADLLRALNAKRANFLAHPDLQEAIQMDEIQEKELRKAWRAYIEIYNARTRRRFTSAIKELEVASTPEGYVESGQAAASSLADVGSAQLAGRRALNQLEKFGQEEMYARLSLVHRACKVMTPVQMAYFGLKQMPNYDIIGAYRDMLNIRLEDLPEAVQPHLSIYFEDVPDSE